MSGRARGRGRGRGSAPVAATPFTWASAPPVTTNSSGSSRRSIVPNIAAAGRLVEPKTETKTTSSEKDVKTETIKNGKNDRIRNSRGRGRGGKMRGNERDKQCTIIKSEGIFSQGFGDGVAGGRTKGNKLSQVKGEETVVGKLDSSIDGFGSDLKMDLDEKKTVKRAKLETKKTGADVYEQYWMSDEELDSEELGELTKDGFISDLKKCSEVPFVLPTKDAPQFLRLSKNEEMRNELKSLMDELENKNERMEHSRDGKFFAAVNSLRQAIDQEGDGNPLMLFQLPSAILHPISPVQLTSTNQSNSHPTTSADTTTTAQPSSDPPANASSTKPLPQHCLHSLPVGNQIGKLQFLRSGRAVLNIGDHRLDISEAIPSNSYETVLRIQAEPQQPPSQTATTSYNSKQFPTMLNGAPFASSFVSSNRFSDTHRPTANSAQLLGEVPYQFVCSFDLQRLVSGAENPQRKGTS